MDMVMGWISKLDVTAIVAAAVSFIAGLSFVKAKLGKAILIIGDLADLLSEVKMALEDGKLSKEEVVEIVKEGEELIAEFKK